MTAKIFKVGVVNATGYVGSELVRLLLSHQNVRLVTITGRSQVGQKLNEVFPHMDLDMTVTEGLSGEEEIVFSAMPHGVGIPLLTSLVDKGLKVIDLSADFRLNEATLYQKWYGFQHSAPQYLAKAVYGLPEINRELIKKAAFIANPGCYPTATILALAPALKEGIIEGDIIADCKSGVSGAGRSLTLRNHFCETDGSVTPYSIATHRHQPEMVQECTKMLGRKVALTFSPHLVPMTRGIVATCYAPLKRDIDQAEVLALYKSFYKDETFIRVLDESAASKFSYGSNKAYISVVVDAENKRLIAVGVIDNLVKGAAGQAIQNMNIMCGLPEDTGLKAPPLFP